MGKRGGKQTKNTEQEQAAGQPVQTKKVIKKPPPASKVVKKAPNAQKSANP